MSSWPLYYCPSLSSSAEKILCGLGELGGVGLAGGQQRGDRPSALVGQVVAVRPGHLADQPVGTQQSQLPRDYPATATGLLAARRRGGVAAAGTAGVEQQRPQV